MRTDIPEVKTETVQASQREQPDFSESQIFSSLPGGVEAFSQTMDFMEQRRQEQEKKNQEAEQKQKEENAGFFSRLWDTVQGAGKSFAGSLVNAVGSLQDVTYGQTSEMLQGDFTQKANAAAEDVRQKEAALQALSGQEGTDAYSDAERELEHAKNELALLQSQVDFFADDARGIQGTYSIADTLSGSANEDLERAKAGLGTLGQFAVDAGAGLAQLGGDLAIGALTGGSALPAMAVRSYGGASQEARLSGADARKASLYGLGSGAVSVLTEKISNVAAPLARAFGKGVADDALETGVRQALDSLAQSDTGRAALQRLGTVLLSAGGEGVEEALESTISPILQRLTYDPNATWDWSEIARDGLLGATIGGIFGLSGSPNENAVRTQQTPTIQQQTQPAAETQQTAIPESLTTQERPATQSPTTDMQQTQQPVQRFTAEAEPQQAAQENIIQHQTISEKDPTHMDNRTFSSVGNRSVPSFQYQHPELHQYYVEAATDLMHDLGAVMSLGVQRKRVSGPGERRYKTQYSDTQLTRKLRSYIGKETSLNDVMQSLMDIINDKGSENYALAKRVELFLDRMLTSGYMSENGYKSTNESYITAKNNVPGGNTDWEQYLLDNELSIIDGLVTEEELRKEFDDMKAGKIPAGMGAASLGFDTYSNLQNQTSNFIPEGENPARVVDVPAQDAQGRNVSRTIRTAMEAEATPDSMLPTLEQMVADGEASYDAITNEDTLRNAEAKIQDNGFTNSYAQWQVDIRGRASAETTATGWALYNAAANAGDINTAASILSDMVGYQRSTAQALQAQRILKKMTPSGQLYAAQQSVSRLQADLTAKYGDQAPNLQLDESLIQEFLQAETQDARDEVLRKIYQDIGRQMPASFVDKWNAWRYLAMLGNPRTQIRNVLGNVGSIPLRTMRNIMSSGAQRLILGEVGEGSKRTRSILNYGNSTDRSRVSYAWNDYANVQDQVMSGGKFDGNVNVNDEIQKGRRIFGQDWNEKKSVGNAIANAVEFARRKNTELLEAGDALFSKPAYVSALASWMKAKGLTPENITTTQLDEGRAFAIREAKIATFRDNNAFSDAVSALGFRNADTTVKKAANALLEGTLPFKKTPANVLVRGVEYSPIGLLNGVKQALVDVKSGNVDVTTAIDSITQGLSGTTVMLLGAYLASQGILTGGDDDDEKQRGQDSRTGHQSYAIEIGDASYTLDWLSPMAIPLFMGAELQNNLAEGEESVFDVLSAIGAGAEPMLEMSMLQSLNELVDSGKYSDGNAMLRILTTMATSYFTQAIPTLSGQIARSTEDVRRSNTTDPTSEIPSELQYTIQQTMGKIPGLIQEKQPYVDEWGRTESSGSTARRIFENFLSPGYVSEINETPIDQELQRLYDAGFTSVFPTKGDKKFSADGVEIEMTPDEYTQYSITKGQSALEMVTALTESEAYAEMSDADRERAITEIYSYSNQLAKSEIAQERGENFEMDGNLQNAMEAQDAGISLADWFKAKFQHDAIEDNAGEDTKKTQMTAEFADWLEHQDYTDEQKTLLREQMRYWNMSPAEAAKYDDMVEIGIPSEKALEVFDAVSELQPEDGKDDVSKAQKYEEIAEIPGLTQSEAYDALYAYEAATEGNRSKVRTAEEAGISPYEYVNWFVDFADAQAEKGGTLSGAEVQEILNSSKSLTREQKSILFVLFAPSGTKGNPYGGAGPKVYDSWVYAQ